MPVHTYDPYIPNFKCPTCNGVCKVIKIADAVELEIDKEAKSNSLRSPGSCRMSWEDGYEKGAREFVKRTEHRVWREATQFIRDGLGEIESIIVYVEGQRRGYVK